MKNSLGFVFSSLTKDSIVNISGSFLNSLLGLIFFILVSRTFGPPLFGVFGVLLAFQVIFSDVFDFGINTGILRFIPQEIAKGEFDVANKFLKLSLELKIFIGFTFILIGLFLSKPLSVLIFKNASYSLPLLFAFAILPTLLLGFSVSYLQSKKEFIKANILNFSSNLARLLILFMILVFGKISVLQVFALFALSPLVGFFVSLFLLKMDFLFASDEWSVFKNFFSFNKWIFLGFSLSSIYSRLDNFFLVRLSNSFQTGLYASSSRLLSFHPQVAGALSITLAPRFSSFQKKIEAFNFFKKSFLTITFFSVLNLFLIPLAPLLVPLLLGIEYQGAVPAFQILSLAMVFILLSVPAQGALIYFLSKPKIFFILSLIQFLVIIIFDLIFIPKYGAFGASLAFLISSFLAFAMPTIFVFSKFKNV